MKALIYSIFILFLIFSLTESLKAQTIIDLEPGFYIMELIHYNQQITKLIFAKAN